MYCSIVIVCSSTFFEIIQCKKSKNVNKCIQTIYLFMSVPQLVGLSLVEIIGDFGLKQYANDGGIKYLGVGIIGYIGVMTMLVVSLQNSSVLVVNNGWDAISSIIESIAAYVILGERFDNYLQYLGIIFIILGLYLLKIPWKKSHTFRIPKN